MTGSGVRTASDNLGTCGPGLGFQWGDLAIWSKRKHQDRCPF